MKKIILMFPLTLLGGSGFASTCTLDSNGNYVCDYGGNLGGGGFSYGEINGRSYDSFGYGDGSNTEIEFEGGQKLDCWRYGSQYECK